MAATFRLPCRVVKIKAASASVYWGGICFKEVAAEILVDIVDNTRFQAHAFEIANDVVIR
jgi:hypothetical protein